MESVDSLPILQLIVYIIGALFGIGFIIIILKSIVKVIGFHLPIHRLKRYRIVKRHTTFNCLDELGEYYKYYIQENDLISWVDVPNKKIYGRKDGELLSTQKQRQDNYFNSFNSANACIENLIKRDELEFRIRIAKKDDEVVNGEPE